LLKYNPVSKVAVFGFMNPVFGVILSAILLSEEGGVSIISVGALVLVCLGIYIVNHKQD
jgi:drug/metabolite transporter (DMT)-like permease